MLTARSNPIGLAVWAGALLFCALPAPAGVHTRLLARVPAIRHGASHRPSPPKPSVPSAADLFVRVLRADDLFTYRGRQITIYWTTGRNTAVEVYHRPPDFRRIYYLDPESQRGRLLVSDGRQEWQYDPRRAEVRHRLLSAGSLDDDDLLSYTLLRANYVLAVDPTPRTYADRRIWLVSVKRPRSLALARRFWIDAGSGLILKREIYHADEKPAVTVAFTDIDFHPKAGPAFDLSHLDASSGGKIRSLESPSGTEEPIPVASLRSQLGGQAYVPTALAGYRIVGASSTMIGGKPLLHLRYSDGLNLVSLFEQRRSQARRPTLARPGMRETQIGPVRGHVSRRASLTTLNWDTPVLNVTLMGEMGTEALRALAQEAVKGR